MPPASITDIGDTAMKHVVSVSIGSSERDHSVVTEFLGQQIKIERVGTDGDEKKAVKLIKEYDGKIDAIGLGGIDLYLVAGNKRHIMRDAKKLADAAKITPVYDGSGLKNTLERQVILQLVADGKYLNKNSKVLLPTSVDRFGMAEAVAESGCDAMFGDFLFGLGLNIPIRNIKTTRALGAVLLPIITIIPTKYLYPTGSSQNERKPKFPKWFQWADVFAGDYLVISKYMPLDITGKIIVTNTVTSKNVKDLKKAGCRALITTTPDLGGRSFGTNVMEAALSAILGKKHGDPTTAQEYIDLIKTLDMKPNIVPLNE